MTAPEPMEQSTRLQVLVVEGDLSDSNFARRVLRDRGDEVEIAKTVPEAAGILSRGHIDVAIIPLSLPRGDGLALVHHLRALYPRVDVLCLTTPAELEEGGHAMALGVLQTIMRPLTGDALLVAVDRARERRVLLRERERLSKGIIRGRRRNATFSRCAAFVAETDQRMVTQGILDACAGEVELAAGAIFAPPYPGASTFVRNAVVADGQDLARTLDATALEDVDPSRPVQADDAMVRLFFLGDRGIAACAVLVPLRPLDDHAMGGLQIIVSLGMAALRSAQKVDAIARTGIKDPETSAYTFAYFGDVAGREIDRAGRHGRRFALLTIGLDGLEALQDKASPDLRLGLRRALTDAVLASVRDSDVLARVEDDEFYLLLPETGLLGALAARRRIATRFARLQDFGPMLKEAGYSPDLLSLVCGISIYPQDGADLGRLLRVSRRRAEQSRDGVWHRLGLCQRTFWDALDQVLGGHEEVAVGRSGKIRLHDELERARDQVDLAQHAVLPRSLLPLLAADLARDASRQRLNGVLYSSGDAEVAAAIGRATGDAGPFRTWTLLSEAEEPAPGTPGPLFVDTHRMGDCILLLALTELGGYALAARPIRSERLEEPSVLAFHASDLDLVDGLVAKLQEAFHLQPQEGT